MPLNESADVIFLDVYFLQLNLLGKEHQMEFARQNCSRNQRINMKMQVNFKGNLQMNVCRSMVDHMFP